MWLRLLRPVNCLLLKTTRWQLAILAWLEALLAEDRLRWARAAICAKEQGTAPFWALQLVK